MDPVQKALWFVESHSREALSLEEIARACKVSTFHLTRAFATSIGLSLMRYVRARRLSDAAKQLAQGADDILRIALDAGYGSHEAFTRAFRDQFALTPEQVRAQGRLDNIPLVEAIAMNTQPVPDFLPPRLETTKPMLLVGLVERYDCRSPAGIPDQWQRFGPHIGRIPGQVGMTCYGVSYNFDADSNFDYLCAVEVAKSTDLPQGLKSLQLPAQKYAGFAFKSHIATIRAAFTTVWNKGIPESGHKPMEAPVLERYGPEFNPLTGLGGYEIWIPTQG